jgi:hypothetical protein
MSHYRVMSLSNDIIRYRKHSMITVFFTRLANLWSPSYPTNPVLRRVILRGNCADHLQNLSSDRCSWAEGNSVVGASSTSKCGSLIVFWVGVRIGAGVFELFCSRSRYRSCAIVVIAAVTWITCKRVGRLAERGQVADGAADRYAVLCSGRISWHNRCQTDAYCLVVSILQVFNTYY